MVDVPVGIVGASAAGLALARALLRHGLEAVVYEARPGPEEDPRPTTLGSRSLEALDRWGLHPSGQSLRRTRITYRGETMGYLPTSEIPSRFPYLLSLTRGGLLQSLAPGARVERGRRVVGLRARDGVEVLLEDGTVRRHRYLVGAAGSVRRLLDVPLDRPDRVPQEVPRWLGRGQSADPEEFDLHLGACGMARSYPATGAVAAEGWLHRGASAPPTLEDLRRELRLPEDWTLEPETVGEWGVARHFRVGPVLLVGPAARRLPEGAWRRSDPEVADADNLGWKLAAVLRQGAPESLLASYELERRPGAPLGGPLPRVCEPRVMSWLGPLLRAAFVRRALGESAAGLVGRYPPSPWSVEEGVVRGGPRAGARLPEVRYEDQQGRRCWLQARVGCEPLVLRFPSKGVVQAGPHRLLDPDGSVWRALGGRRGAVLVVRPDAVVGYRAFPENPQRTADYLGRLQGDAP